MPEIPFFMNKLVPISNHPLPGQIFITNFCLHGAVLYTSIGHKENASIDALEKLEGKCQATNIKGDNEYISVFFSSNPQSTKISATTSSIKELTICDSICCAAS